MDFLSNPVWQFIITISITIILSLISTWVAIWLASKRSVKSPLQYECIALQRADESEKEVSEMLENMQVLDNGGNIQIPCFVTFKIMNCGKDTIILPDASIPLIIPFHKGDNVLHCEQVETVPNHLEVKITFDAEKIFLVFGVLKRKESITIKVLFDSWVNYIPKFDARISNEIQTVKANNKIISRDSKILSLILFFLSIYFFVIYMNPFTHNQGTINFILFFAVMLLISSIGFYLKSWQENRMPPLPYPPMSMYAIAYLKESLRGLPFLIVIGVVAVITYTFFGTKGLGFLWFSFISIIAPIGFWHECYASVSEWLQKRNKTYNSVLLIILTGILPIILFGMCLFIFILLILYAI